MDESDSDPRAEERVGTVLDGKWTLERTLGSGGMGAVYAARHRNGARAAVKVLHPELARRPDVRERFLREGYAANRVEHRGAVRVLDDDIIEEGPDEGTAYLVMEILEGESLEQRLERAPKLTELELLAILDDVLAVLEAAHANGVVHRDLKPANLFLNADPAGPGVKVLDFGLARLEELRSVTGVGLALGTPSFMAPEQANGQTTEIDARTDLFAVGATAFSILAGRGVHEAEGVLELVARMGTLPAPKLREVAPQVSEPVANIVDRALEFAKADRYPSATAMRADLASAREALAPKPPPVDEPRSERAEPTKTEGRKKSGGSRALLVLMLFIGAGIVLVLVVPRATGSTTVPAAVSELFSSHATANDASADAVAPGASSSTSDDLDATATTASALLFDDLDAAAADSGGDAAADDDDDDDDDVDASDVAAIVGGRDAGPSAATARPSAVNRPRPPPGRVKHPKKKKPKRRH